MAAVSELVSASGCRVGRLGYKPSTMVWYRGCWRRLERYFASRGVQEFSLDVAMAWVDEACGGFFEKEQAGTLKATDVYLFRVAAMLGRLRGPRVGAAPLLPTVDKLSVEQAGILAAVPGVAWGRRVARSRRSGRMARLSGSFSRSPAARGGLAGLDGGVVGAFVLTLAGYQAKTVEHKLCAVRSFLRFAAAGGLIDRGVLEKVPAVRSSRQARVPSVWDPADVTKDH